MESLLLTQFYQQIASLFPRSPFSGVLFEFDEDDFPDPEQESANFWGYDWLTFDAESCDWFPEHYAYLTPDGFKQLLPLFLRLTAEDLPESEHNSVFWICAFVGERVYRDEFTTPQLVELDAIFKKFLLVEGETESYRQIYRTSTRLGAILKGTFRE
jgi:hypothetical protein